MPALKLDDLAQLFTTIASEACKPVQGKGFTKQRKARQTITLNCVSDEYGGDTFTLKFSRKLPHHVSPYCEKCGDTLHRSKKAARRF